MDSDNAMVSLRNLESIWKSCTPLEELGDATLEVN